MDKDLVSTRFRPLIVVFCGIAVCVTAFEGLKEILFHDHIDRWQSHLLTIAAMSIVGNQVLRRADIETRVMHARDIR